ncbi:MAG: citrate (Si)-synthase [Anaerolineae bacterium]|jgi:citrate synthase|nr:citrate (Si)-synthase [Anaerolineae bacterium]
MWLHEILKDKIEDARNRLQRVKQEYSDQTVSEVKVKHLFNGLRGADLLISQISHVDPQEGVQFYDYSVDQVLEVLPRAEGSELPLAGGMYFLLLTGEVPTRDQALAVEEEWRRRSDLPYHVADMLRAMPRDTHPMTMFSQAILALQSRSEFTRHYTNGMQKTDYWQPTLEDSLNLVAKAPAIAAAIYNIKYHSRGLVPPSQTLDWSANFAYMINKEWDTQYMDLCRLFFVVHSEQGIGNVCEHTAWLVNSALSDVYFACSAAMNGLAGPLHGRANQDSLEWLLGILHKFGECPSEELLEEYIWDTLNRGKIIPGYGHSVLRKTDPRFLAQLEFGRKSMGDDSLFQLVELVYKVAPRVLQEYGKVSDPWPNVDAISGAMQYHCGLHEYDFYTVLFGVGRVIGITANLVWSRALYTPIERPQSLTLAVLERQLGIAAG